MATRRGRFSDHGRPGCPICARSLELDHVEAIAMNIGALPNEYEPLAVAAVIAEETAARLILDRDLVSPNDSLAEILLAFERAQAGHLVRVPITED